MAQLGQPGCDVRAAGQAEELHDPPDLGADPARGQVQPSRDLPVRQTVREEDKDIMLERGQRRHTSGLSRGYGRHVR